MYKFIRNTIASCIIATCLSFVLHINTANAFLASPGMFKRSIAWDFVAIAQGKLKQDINYPICLPTEKLNTAEGIIFLALFTEITNLWNDHAKSAIGDEWPINTVAFHTNISDDDCNRKTYLHESGETIKPMRITFKDSGGFSAGDHNINFTEAAFDTMPNHYRALAHEYGHILGLSDDYKGSSIQGGRPPSMMKIHEQLQEEDKVALKYLWDNRGNYDDAQCPDTHFKIDDGYHGIYWAAGAQSCLPYLKDNVINNLYLQKYNITNPENCIIFMDDPNADISLFNGDVGTQQRYRENAPEEYFAGAPTHDPICLSEKNSSGDFEPLSVFLNIDNMNKADSLWVGSNVYANIRMLKKQPEGRYLTIKERNYSYPFAWFDNQWAAFDKDSKEMIEMDYDAFSISIVDQSKEMIAANIAPLDLNRSEELNPMTWPEPDVISKITKQQPSISCASLNINESGAYMIARDVLSDQEVYCEVEEQGSAWTYLGFVNARAHLKPFFHYSDNAYYSDNVNQVQDLDVHGDEELTYSNGLASKLQDDEMLIKVKDFNNGPKIYLQYDNNIPFFNDMYHRICEDFNTYNVQVKIDWPDDEREQWASKEQWPDNEYHDAEISCYDNIYTGLHQHINVTYKDKSLGEDGEIFSVKLNLAFGIKLHNQEWTQENPPENPLEDWRVAQENQKGWIFVRNSQETDFVDLNTNNHEWDFNEGSGNVVSDSVGELEGVINGATWATGYINNGLDYNGTSDSVDISGAAVNTLDSFSVSAWVKLNSLEGWQTAVSQDAINVSGFYLQKTTYGQLAFAVTKKDKSDNNNGSIRAESSFIAVVDKWYHLVGVHDVSSQEIKLFVNGVLESTKAFTTPWNVTGNTVIGRAKWRGRYVDYFSGSIDEVKIYNSALTETEIQNLFSSNSR